MSKQIDNFFILSKYEYATILTKRAREIEDGAKILLHNIDSINPVEIAQQEYDAGLLNYRIIREHPNGNIDIFNIK